MDNKLKEGIEFFRNNKKYHRTLKELAEKYKSRGTLGGRIELLDVTEEERDFLCKIDPKYIYAKDAQLTFKKFLKTFENTLIAELDFLEILQGFFNGKLVTNKEINQNKASRRELYFQEIAQEFEGTPSGNWLKESLNHKKYGYLLLAKEYEKNPPTLKSVLMKVMKAINELEYGANNSNNNPVRLPIFASKLTKDPHFFDTSQLGGKLLLSGLAFLVETKAPENAEEESELLYFFGILKDEISNYTTVSSIEAYTAAGIHNGIAGFHHVEPIQLNLWNLSKIEEIKCKDHRIFVFENPAVFSEVLERTSEVKPSLLCTSGQLKLASLVLLDKLVKNTEKIHYSGDFDPEGIKIAYRLKQRYGDKLELWRYNVDEYEKIKSQVTFDERRWNQISTIEEPQLKRLIEHMERDKLCGYQELLVEEYVGDIIEFVKLP